MVNVPHTCVTLQLKSRFKRIAKYNTLLLSSGYSILIDIYDTGTNEYVIGRFPAVLGMILGICIQMHYTMALSVDVQMSVTAEAYKIGCMLMRDEEGRMEETSKVKQTTKQSNTAHPRWSLFRLLLHLRVTKYAE